MTNTLQTLRVRVQDRTNRPIGGSDEDVSAQINDAYFSVVRELGTSYTSALVDLVPNQGDYSITADFELSMLSLKYVEYGRNGLSLPIEQVSQGDIIRLRGITPGTSAAFYYAMVGLDFLSIYPAPQADDTMRLWYFAAPTPLEEDDDEIDALLVPEGWQELITLKACVSSILHMNRGKPQGYISTAAQSDQFEAKYQAMLSGFRRERNFARGSNGRTVEFGPPRWPRYSNDTDVRGRD